MEKLMLQAKWDIHCPEDCACKDKDLAKQMREARSLDATIASSLQAGRAKRSLRSAK